MTGEMHLFNTMWKECTHLTLWETDKCDAAFFVTKYDIAILQP